MDVQKHIRDLCKQIVDRFDPKKVILFGSYAYGVPRADSDIDLLVIMSFEGGVHDQAVKIRKNLISPMPIDLLVRTPEQLRERVEMEDFFMREIVYEGKTLYEASHA